MKNNRTDIEITPRKALELGYTHFVIEDREVVEPIEDYDPDSERACYLVEPVGRLPMFDAKGLSDYLIEYHEDLPEVCIEQIEEFIKSKKAKIQSFIDSLNAEIADKNVGVFYPGTCYILIPDSTDLAL